MPHYLFKSEPDVFGWEDLVAKGEAGEEWDGVRNYQARNVMRGMAVGETGFFYHSRSGLEIVGTVEIIAEAHPDSTAKDGTWECVDVKALDPLPRPVSLDEIKSDDRLSDMVLVRNARLSVQPVTDDEWALILTLAQSSA